MKKLMIALVTLFLLCACSDDESIDGGGMTEFPAFTYGTLKSSNVSDGFDYEYNYLNVNMADLDNYVAELAAKGFKKAQGNSYAQLQYSKQIGATRYNVNIFWGNSNQAPNELYLNFEIEP